MIVERYSTVSSSYRKGSQQRGNGQEPKHPGLKPSGKQANRAPEYPSPCSLQRGKTSQACRLSTVNVMMMRTMMVTIDVSSSGKSCGRSCKSGKHGGNSCYGEHDVFHLSSLDCVLFLR
jgi:hypothetical protein